MTYERLAILGCSLLCLLTALITAPAQAAEPPRAPVKLKLGDKTESAAKTSASSVMTVVVTGVGLDPAKARQNAFSNALEQVVGVLVDAETIVENDKVIRDQVHTLTSGFVEELDVIDIWQEDGLHFARIRAKVAAGKLGEKLEKQNVAVRKIPAALLYQRVKHEILNEENAKKMFRSATADFSPDKFMTVEVLDREPEVERTGQRVKLTVTYRLSSNPKGWDGIYTKLKPLFNQIARMQTPSMCAVSTRGRYAWSFATQPNADRDKEISVNLFESSNPDATSTSWHSYVLPNWLEPDVRGLGARQDSYQVHLTLVDSEDREVASLERPLQARQVVKLNTLGGARYLSSAIGPLVYTRGYRNSVDLTAVFSLTVDQLELVDKCVAYIELIGNK